MELPPLPPKKRAVFHHPNGMVSYSDEPERVEVRVLCAKALPDRVMIVAVSNDGSVGWHWDDDQNKAPIA